MTQFAFVFPGQGSQTVGMLADMAASYPIVEETFADGRSQPGGILRAGLRWCD